MIRNVSKELLKRYFEGRGLLVDFDWDKYTEHAPEPIIEAIELLATKERTAVDFDLFTVNELATDGGSRLIYEEAIFGTLKPGDAPKMARFGNRVIVYQLKEILPPAPSPMEEVREQIAERVKKQLAREKLSGEIDGLRKALLSGVPADRAAKSIKGAESGETGVFARNESGNAGNVSGVDVVNKIGRSGQLKLSAFMLKRPGDVAGPFEVDDRLVMVRLKSRLDPDPALREKQLEEVREDLFRKLRSEVQGQLLDKIKAETRLDLKVDVDKLLKRDEAEG